MTPERDLEQLADSTPFELYSYRTHPRPGQVKLSVVTECPQWSLRTEGINREDVFGRALAAVRTKLARPAKVRPGGGAGEERQ